MKWMNSLLCVFGAVVLVIASLAFEPAAEKAVGCSPEHPDCAELRYYRDQYESWIFEAEYWAYEHSLLEDYWRDEKDAANVTRLALEAVYLALVDAVADYQQLPQNQQDPQVLAALQDQLQSAMQDWESAAWYYNYALEEWLYHMDAVGYFSGLAFDYTILFNNIVSQMNGLSCDE